jgi:hypothetical protein
MLGITKKAGAGQTPDDTMGDLFERALAYGRVSIVTTSGSTSRFLAWIDFDTVAGTSLQATGRGAAVTDAQGEFSS